MTTTRRPRGSHSREAVVSAAIELLDEAGEGALTFRALAQRLGGGVSSIYWYVSDKGELLDRAADHALGEIAATTAAHVGSPDPLEDVRAIAVTLHDELVARPWLGMYCLREPGVQPNGFLLFDRIGQQVMRLGLSARESFNAVSAVVGFVVGIAGNRILEEAALEEHTDASRVALLDAITPESHPFADHVLEEFRTHDDAELFRAGLDLLLAGIRLQADAAAR